MELSIFIGLLYILHSSTFDYSEGKVHCQRRLAQIQKYCYKILDMRERMVYISHSSIKFLFFQQRLALTEVKSSRVLVFQIRSRILDGLFLQETISANLRMEWWIDETVHEHQRYCNIQWPQSILHPQSVQKWHNPASNDGEKVYGGLWGIYRERTQIGSTEYCDTVCALRGKI